MNTPPLDPLGQMINKYQTNGQHSLAAAIQPPLSPVVVQLSPTTVQSSQAKKSVWTDITIFGKTSWDWLNLIGVLLVPLMIGVFTIATTIQQSQISQQQFSNSLQLSQRQHDSDQAIATDQQKAATLKAYLDDMTDLMLNKGLRQSKPDDEVRVVARAKTLVTLDQLDGQRKGILLQFLYEAHLINGKEPIISLQGVTISELFLTNAHVKGINLHGAELFGAIFSDSDLSGADLSDADLYGVHCEGGILANTNLSRADLTNTDFYCADLSGANLTNAIVTPEQLALATYLKDTTLPDGSKYPSKSYPIPNHKEP